MTNIRIFIFFGIIFSIFSLLGLYVFTRLEQTFPAVFVESNWGLAAFVFLLFAFFIGKVWERFQINEINGWLIRIGSVAAGFFLYTLFLILFFDMVRLLHSIIPFYPDFISQNYEQTKLIIGISGLVIISMAMFKGYWNTTNPKVKKLDLEISKPQSSLKDLNICGCERYPSGNYRE
jgi:hypothetical protein